jgi:anti-sigma factor RsiW
MDCSVYHEAINRYVDGDVSDAEVARFQAHLSFCPDCAAELRELSHVRTALGQWGAVELSPPAGFATRVLAAEERRPADERGDTADAPASTAGSLKDGAKRVRPALPASLPARVLTLIALVAAALAVGLETRHLIRSREVKA